MYCKLPWSELSESVNSLCLLPSLCHKYFCRSLFSLFLTSFFYTRIIGYLGPLGNHATPLLISAPSSGAFSSCFHVVFKTWMHYRFIQKNSMFCPLFLSYQILFPFLITFLTALEFWADNVRELTAITSRCLS